MVQGMTSGRDHCGKFDVRCAMKRRCLARIDRSLGYAARPARGVTLLELLIVLSIMAFVATIVQRGDALLVIDVDARSFTLPPDTRVHRLPEKLDVKLFTAQRDLVGEKIGAIRFFPDGGSNGGRITLAAGERKYDVDVDWLTGRVTILE